LLLGPGLRPAAGLGPGADGGVVARGREGREAGEVVVVEGPSVVTVVTVGVLDLGGSHVGR
jgi:hypothetical protein